MNLGYSSTIRRPGSAGAGARPRGRVAVCCGGRGGAAAGPPACLRTGPCAHARSHSRQNFRSRGERGVICRSHRLAFVLRLSYHLCPLCVSRVVSRVCRVSRSRVSCCTVQLQAIHLLSTDSTRPCITHQSGSDSASRSACGERLEGNSTSARTCSVPLRGGSAPRRGIPLPRTLMTCMGAVTSERSSFTRWPSRWTRAVSKPSSAAWLGLGLGLGLA